MSANHRHHPGYMSSTAMMSVSVRYKIDENDWNM